MDHVISYDLARGLHIIAVIAWVAGLLMLPRFFAYITASTPGGELETSTLKSVRSLQSIILIPSMILAWSFGLFLFFVHLPGFGGGWDRPIGEMVAGVPHWFWGKLILVLGLTGYQGFLSAQGRKLAKGERRFSERFWRIMGEVPFLVAIVVVLLATLEPG